MKAFPFNQARVDETYNYALNVNNIITPLNPEDTHLSAIKARFTPCIEKLDKAHLKPSTKIDTKKLRELDRIRDKIFRGFRDYCGAFTRCNEEDKEAAAELLVECINLHGRTLYADGDAVETSRLEKLLTDLTGYENLSAAIVKINATDWQTKLTKAHNDFKNFYTSRNETQAQREHIDSQQAIQALKSEIDLLFKYIDTMADLNVDQSWIDARYEIDELTSSQISQIKSRKTRNSNEKEETENIQQ
jgi:hypothetical protein